MRFKTLEFTLICLCFPSLHTNQAPGLGNAPEAIWKLTKKKQKKTEVE